MIGSVLILLSLYMSSPDINKKIDDYLGNYLNNYSRFEFEIVNMPAELNDIDFIDGNSIQISNGIANLPVNIIRKSGKVTKGFLSLRLKLYREVYSAAKLITRKTPLKSSDFEVKEMEISNMNGTIIPPAENIEKFEAKININPGTVLIKEYINSIPLIKAGDQVTAVIVKGFVSLATDATARQDGTEGEEIRIVTGDKKLFKAKVIDSQNVLITE